MPNYKTTVAPDGGIVSAKLDPSLIDAIQSTGMNNVHRVGDYFGKRPGRTSYGNASGIVMNYFHFKTASTNKFMKFTNTGIYTRGSAGWDNVSGAALTGDIDDFIDACVAYDDSSGTWYVVFTNGNNAIRKYTGTGNTADLGGWGAYLAKYVRYYKGYLVCAYLTFSGTVYPFRFRCSHTDAPEDITSANSKNFNLTQDKNMSDIMRVEHFGDYLAFYKTDCIYMAYLGSTTNIFEWDLLPWRDGLRAPRALAVGKQGEHFFLGYKDFYYMKSPESEPQGLSSERVKNPLFENTDPQYLTRAFAHYDTEYERIRLYVPESSYLNKVYSLDLRAKKWTWWEEEVSNITAIGEYLTHDTTTIDELTGTIDSLSGTIDSLSGTIRSNYPIFLEGDKDGNSRYQDDSVYNDGNITIDAYYDTGDRVYEETNADGVPFNYKRVLGLKIEAKGDQGTGDFLEILYSTDEGTTWTQITAGLDDSDTVWTNKIPLTDSWAWYEAHFDVTARKIRFRFRNDDNGSTFQVRKWCEIFEDGDA